MQAADPLRSSVSNLATHSRHHGASSTLCIYCIHTSSLDSFYLPVCSLLQAADPLQLLFQLGHSRHHRLLHFIHVCRIQTFLILISLSSLSLNLSISSLLQAGDPPQLLFQFSHSRHHRLFLTIHICISTSLSPSSIFLFLHFCFCRLVTLCSSFSELATPRPSLLHPIHICIYRLSIAPPSLPLSLSLSILLSLHFCRLVIICSSFSNLVTRPATASSPYTCIHIDISLHLSLVSLLQAGDPLQLLFQLCHSRSHGLLSLYMYPYRHPSLSSLLQAGDPLQLLFQLCHSRSHGLLDSLRVGHRRLGRLHTQGGRCGGLVVSVCVSSVWIGPLCGSVPCCLGRPSVRGSPLWVGPLWVPSPTCVPVVPMPSTRLMSLARAPAPAVLEYKHANDSFFYTTVEPDSLIAVLWHLLSFSAFDCL